MDTGDWPLLDWCNVGANNNEIKTRQKVGFGRNVGFVQQVRIFVQDSLAKEPTHKSQEVDELRDGFVGWDWVLSGQPITKCGSRKTRTGFTFSRFVFEFFSCSFKFT